MVQLQCYFWIAFMAFATIGCSAKKTFFEAFAIEVEAPLSGSKAVSVGSTLNCQVEVVSQESTSIKKGIIQVASLVLSESSMGGDLSGIPIKKIFKKGYLLKLAGNSPPIYVMLKQFKFALL